MTKVSQIPIILNKLKLEEVVDKIYHLEFPSRLSLNKALIRFQEHYESQNPTFRRSAFSLIEFKKWYSPQHGGKFTYYGDWGGCNFPSSVLELFYKGDFDPLTPQENTLLDVFKEDYTNGEKFYVIGTFRRKGKPDKIAMKHEIHHGLYYLNSDYKELINDILKDLSPKTRRMINKFLRSEGYTSSVLKDETAGWLMTELNYHVKGHKKCYLVEKGIMITKELLDANKRLNETFDMYYRKKL
jgi:hypothetical protein